MAMNRAGKEAAIADYKERFETDETVVLVRNDGLTVSQMAEFRTEMRNEGGRFKIVKNKLAKRALEGTKCADIADLFVGPTGVASSQDPVAAAKIVHKFAKDNDKLVIVGGMMGANVLDKAGVEQLAKMPSLDELRGTLIGLLQAPAQKVVGVIAAPAGQLARVVGAYAAKGE
jgi:large subunit ribosomal protein L10